MRRVLGWMMVLFCCSCAVGMKREDTPDARLTEAQADFDEAIKKQGAGDYSTALPRAEHALALREAVLGSRHPEVASCLNLVGVLYRKQGALSRAEPLLQRALALREAALGENHPLVATSLNNLALLYADQGLYERAEPLLQRALTLREAALGKNHPLVADSLNSLSLLYADMGLYDRAEPLSQRALAIKEAVLGNNHPEVALLLNNLARLYGEQGFYTRAEPLLQRALAIQETAPGKSRPDVALSLTNLANLYLNQGLPDRAELLYQRALDIREATLGKSHPLFAASLQNLAISYLVRGLYARAEPLLQRALAVREAVLGKNHPKVAQSLQNLAQLYEDQGLHTQAEPLYRRALAIREATLGPHHPDVAISLHSLAGIYLEQGLYDRAEPLLQRALAIREAALGPHHPDLAFSLSRLAHLRQVQNRLAESLPLYSRALAIDEFRLRQEALDFSEPRVSGLLDYLREDEQRLYTLLRAHPEDASVRRLVLSAVLLMKGRSVEEMANISRTLYRSLGAEDRARFEQLRGLRTQLARLSLMGPGSSSLEDHQRHLKTLTDQGDSLEADLATHSARLRALSALPPAAELVERVAASLPEQSALVEFIAYEDSLLTGPPGTPRTQDSSPLRYLALMLFPDGSTRAVDLGPAGPIDRAATRLRNALASRDAAFLAPARDLYQRVFQPLLPLPDSTRRLLLSPDGQLGLVPFAALHDGHGFLLDSYDFTYLTSGRELLPRLEQDQAPASSVVVLADPDFTAPPPPVTPSSSGGARPAGSESSEALERFFSRVRGDGLGSAWEPLPGTRREAESIQLLLPQAQLFLGPEATKQRLLTLPTPGILHLATHGFFLEDDPAAPEGSRALGHSSGLAETLQTLPRDPLLRSGLALAGVRAPAPDASTPSEAPAYATLVTALEMAGLDLWGTQLVILSACDTGRGDVHLGQGVYGLRRALVAAGAETVVMSLWKVRDDSTQQLMEAYYRHLVSGGGRASALREAMRSLRASHPHPHDWAPFIVLGSDTPLRGITPAVSRTSGKP